MRSLRYSIKNTNNNTHTHTRARADFRKRLREIVKAIMQLTLAHDRTIHICISVLILLTHRASIYWSVFHNNERFFFLSLFVFFFALLPSNWMVVNKMNNFHLITFRNRFAVERYAMCEITWCNKNRRAKISAPSHPYVFVDLAEETWYSSGSTDIGKQNIVFTVTIRSRKNQIIFYDL